MASQEGHLDVVKVLLASHPEVNAQEADGETALHLAAFYGHLGVAQVLLKNGADLRIENKERKTPLDLASKERHDDIVQLLKSTALVREWGGELVAEQQVGEDEMIAE
jgi:ankyrin repeat protein